MAVVDPELRVYGVEGLRVADASVMPVVPSGNCHAAIMMISERGADLIKADHGISESPPLLASLRSRKPSLFHASGARDKNAADFSDALSHGGVVVGATHASPLRENCGIFKLALTTNPPQSFKSPLLRRGDLGVRFYTPAACPCISHR